MLPALSGAESRALFSRPGLRPLRSHLQAGLVLCLVLLAGAVLAQPAGERGQPWQGSPHEALPRGVVVVIDPGHGGANRGALGPDGTQEKSINLAVALRMQELLEAESELRVVLTRERDHHLGLKERAEVANVLGAALLLSIHCNSAPRVGPRGYESLFLSISGMHDPAHPGVLHEPLDARGDTEQPEALVAAITADLMAQTVHQRSELLARMLDEEMALRLEGPNRGVRQASFDVLIHAAVPAAVVEVGFLNHPHEGRLLASPAYQEEIALALAAAVRRYVERVPGDGQPF